MKEMKVIDIAKDFSRFPTGRKKRDGNTSGEEFREKHLMPLVAKRTPLTVILDGTIGYGSSFLDEAFGGLVRECNISADEALSLITLETKNKALKQEIIKYIKEALD